MRHNRIRNVVIELTSLLDIVMILIFAVMIQNSRLVEASNQERSELQIENAGMQNDLAKYEEIAEELSKSLEELGEDDLGAILDKLHNAENQLNVYECMDNIVAVYNVELKNSFDNTSRRLTFGRVSDENTKPREYVGRNDTSKWTEEINTLNRDINKFINNEQQDGAEDKYIYLVFSVDKSKVYSNDYDNIEKILKDYEAKYGSDKVRYKPNFLEGE